MRSAPGIRALFVGLIVLTYAGAAPAETPVAVGRVESFERNRAFIYHNVTAGQPSRRERIEDTIQVNHLDVLQARGTTELRMSWQKAGRSDLVLVGGTVYFYEDESVNLAEVQGGLVRVEGEPGDYKPASNLVVTNPFGTIYEIEAQARESRVFVYEGVVEVTSRDPRFPDPVMVLAGQWVRAREGEPLSDPKPVILVGIGLDEVLGPGGRPCLDSDCTFVNEVLIPPPPSVTPGDLRPPPPNPPGRR